MGIETSIVTEYSPEVAAGIGALLPQLSPRFSTEPVPRVKLEQIINSERDQLVAHDRARVVGAATMNVLIGAGKQDEGWLEDFVVDKNIRGQAVGSQLWDLMISWCRQKGLASFSFETESYRHEAIQFYLRHGAEVVGGTTTHYRVPVPALRSGEDSVDSLPREVRSAYNLLPTARLRHLSGGIINQTDVVIEHDRSSVLQRLSPVFERAVIYDAAFVAAGLEMKGWETPTALFTRSGEQVLEDSEGQLWRRLKFIESDGSTPDVTPELFASSAELLGRWHRDAASINYNPQFKIPHFHDTQYHAEELLTNAAWLPGHEALQLAWGLLEDYQYVAHLPDAPPQIIHGDPKLDNLLYRDGQPFTLIDFDTLMRGSPWLDVGDLLRSLASRRVRNNTALTEQELRAFADAYRQAAGLEIDPEACFQASVRAGQLIALELGMRFLNDISSEYFAWDEQTYPSQRDNHVAKATEQQAIAKALGVWNSDHLAKNQTEKGVK